MPNAKVLLSQAALAAADIIVCVAAHAATRAGSRPEAKMGSASSSLGDGPRHKEGC